VTVPASGAAETRPCPQCDGLQALRLERYSTPEWGVVACIACGFVFLQNPPSYERLEQEFAWEKTAPAEARRRHAKRPFVMWLEDATRWRLHAFPRKRSLYGKLFRGGRVLDVGCGDSVAAPEPCIPFGIEISQALYEKVAPLMAARGGRAEHGASAEVIATFPDRYFSGVILRSVVEHEAQPKRLLAGVARVLQADGSVYIRVPNFGSVNRMVNGGDWCGIRHPDHVNYFTLASLKQMTADVGFDMRLLHPIRLPFDDNINAVLTLAAVH
jgi:SAM-dependent methyltransferase